MSQFKNNNTFVVEGKIIIVNGIFVKIGKIKDEFWKEDKIDDYKLFIDKLKWIHGRVDIFTFSQMLPYTECEYDYYMEKDNVAALKITSYEHWFKTKIDRSSRRAIAKAEKSGLDVRLAMFNDDFVKGIEGIYNETPFRQGKRFWHYGKTFNRVKDENSTFLNQSDFIGAYYKEELVGFIKIVYKDNIANMMQILSKIEHRDKSPTNALISKAVEICEARKAEYLTYGSFIYGNKLESPLMDFKRRNGFEKIDLPRYYVPLNIFGDIALKFNLHKNIIDLLPEYLINMIVYIRTKWYSIFT